MDYTASGFPVDGTDADRAWWMNINVGPGREYWARAENGRYIIFLADSSIVMEQK